MERVNRGVNFNLEAKMKYDYYIAMPTRGRVNKQSTLQRLRPEIRKMVNVYCHPGEMDLFKKLYSDQVASIQEYDKDCTHIGEIREYILFNSNSKNVIFMDDNLRF